MIVVVGCASLAVLLEALFESPIASAVLLSPDGVKACVEALHGTAEFDVANRLWLFDAPWWTLFTLALGSSVLVSAVVVTRCSVHRAAGIISNAWLWWWMSGVPVLWDGVSLLVTQESAALLMANVGHVLAISLAGWWATLVVGWISGRTDQCVSLASVTSLASRQAPSTSQRFARPSVATVFVVLGMLAYVVVFTAMNWQLYWNLMLPHGDSAMYEEHLWNLTHGKGFRSYLDQGLFLGEHIQVVHVLLLPLYQIWPSHLLLELCQSIALAAGAYPVFAMARRATNSPHIGVFLAWSYLLYPPMQFLDIAIDFKTFRPEAFVIPAYLFALDQFERRRFKTAVMCLLIGLSAKEDYAIPVTLFGGWMVLTSCKYGFHPELSATSDSPTTRIIRWKGLTIEKRRAICGLALMVLSVAYLLIATRLVMPYFRSGNELHYVRYFSKFGTSFGEVVLNMLTSPRVVFAGLTSATSIVYLLAIFVPLSFVPGWSLSRTLFTAPLLVLLCLNEVIQQDPFPRHHFQSSVIPLLFWSVTGALGKLHFSQPQANDGSSSATWWQRLKSPHPEIMAALVLGSCLVATITSGQSPLSIKFWDPGSIAYWKKNYLRSPRAQAAELLLAKIPRTARVASTDFIHTHLTHCERSYDYSHYPRAVANYEDRVPADTDWIVIDTGHRYSDIHDPSQVRELQREPERWELLDWDTAGYFIVLRAKNLKEPGHVHQD